MFSNAGALESKGWNLSPYERVLGVAFDDLDAQLQTYFGPIPAGSVGMGVGRYSESGLRVRALRPLFALLGLRRIAFAEHGVDVPFTVMNVSGPQRTLNATRTFRFAAVTREMTDSMRVIDGKLIDRIGARGEIEIELAAHVVDGELHLDSRRLALRMLGVRLRLPQIVKVTLREKVDSGDPRLQHVELTVTMPGPGQVYGYHGTFAYMVTPVAQRDLTWSQLNRFIRGSDR